MIGRLFTYTTPEHFPRTITGRPATVRTPDELDALIAQRHSKGDAARRGWSTRRAGR